MKKSRIGLVIINSLILSVVFTGCAIHHHEIDKVIFVRAVAVDKSTASGKIRLEVAAESTITSPGKGESQRKNMAVSSEGSTVFDANRNFSDFTDKDIFWGHTQYIVLGETAAREDVLKYLDFFIRNHENRLTASISVVHGATGSELIKACGSAPVHEKLSGIYENIGGLSVSKEIRLSEFAEKLSSKYSSAYLPCFNISNSLKEKGGDEGEKSIELEGIAVFKGKSLINCIHGKEARGLNWVNGDVESGIIVVKDPGGGSISLEIIDTEAKISTTVKDGIPGVTVKIGATTNLGEIEGQRDVFDKETISMLEKQQADIIKDEVLSAINFAQQNNVDVFGFGDKIFHQHPVKWEGIKDNWNKLFPKINVEVEIKTKINRSYNIRQPIRSWEENKK